MTVCDTCRRPTGEYCDNVTVLTPIVPFHDKLMCPSHQGQAVIVIERFRDILSEGVPCTSRTDAPTTSIIRITPQQIAHWPFMRYLLDSVQRSDIVEGVDAR